MSGRTTAEGWRPDTSMGGVGGGGGDISCEHTSLIRTLVSWQSRDRGTFQGSCRKRRRAPLGGATAWHWEVQLKLCITL